MACHLRAISIHYQNKFSLDRLFLNNIIRYFLIRGPVLQVENVAFI